VASESQDFRFGQPRQSERDAALYVPDLAGMAASNPSEMREVVERFCADRDAMLRFYDVPGSTLHLSRLDEFYEAWQVKLEEIPFASLGVAGRIDWLLLQGRLKYLRAMIERSRKNNSEVADILPISQDLANLQESRREFFKLDPKVTALVLCGMQQKLAAVKEQLSLAPDSVRKSLALRALNKLGELEKILNDWFGFYDGYDPLFGWWNRAPHSLLLSAIADYRRFLRETVLGVKAGEDEPIVGDPIGRDGLAIDLAHDMIPYTPQELINIAEKELTWCLNEWKLVAKETGCGEDWKKALGHIMSDHVLPGEQPELIARQAYEAIHFVAQRDLLTVPPLAIDIWRMGMMTPAAQKVSPFFLGGEQIKVSFPTDSMEHLQKLDSLRANNMHLARATVHHELIPGHHLQGFARERYNPHRKAFNTPFWVEGWALWWEFLLWDLGFPKTPENRGGMLFWRTHRAARVIFSLNFHLGHWTPAQCIEFLVDTVGHDRHTATGEVRRSFNGNYPPLYQAAYMIGAIQFRALHAELVATGRMSIKDFHDRIIIGNQMPVEMVRANLCGTLLPKDHRSGWKFAEKD